MALIGEGCIERDELELFSGDPGPLEYAGCNLKLPGGPRSVKLLERSTLSSSFLFPPFNLFLRSFFTESCIDDDATDCGGENCGGGC